MTAIWLLIGLFVGGGLVFVVCRARQATATSEIVDLTARLASAVAERDQHLTRVHELERELIAARGDLRADIVQLAHIGPKHAEGEATPPVANAAASGGLAVVAAGSWSPQPAELLALPRFGAFSDRSIISSKTRRTLHSRRADAVSPSR